MKPPFVNWATLFSVGGLGILFWQDVFSKFHEQRVPSQDLPPEMLQVFLVVSIVAIGVGMFLFLKTSGGTFFDRIMTAIGYETWSECAGLLTGVAWILAAVALVGDLIGGEFGALLASAIVPTTFAAVAALVSFAGLGVEATNTNDASKLLRWVLSLCWVFTFGGILTLTFAGLFMWLPIPLILSLAGVIAFAVVCTWARFRKDNAEFEHPLEIRRARKVGLYQAGFVPLVSLGAVTFASGQLAPIYMAIGLVTMTLGLRKMSQTFAA